MQVIRSPLTWPRASVRFPKEQVTPAERSGTPLTFTRSCGRDDSGHFSPSTHRVTPSKESLCHSQSHCYMYFILDNDHLPFMCSRNVLHSFSKFTGKIECRWSTFLENYVSFQCSKEMLIFAGASIKISIIKYNFTLQPHGSDLLSAARARLIPFNSPAASADLHGATFRERDLSCYCDGASRSATGAANEGH